MTVGIAIRDDVGITHWAPYSNRSERAVYTGQSIARELRKTGKPRLLLACEGYNRCINQVRRVSTLVSSVTCMACILRM